MTFHALVAFPSPPTRAWAVNVGNHELAERVNFSHYRLLTGRGTASAERCHNIHAAAAEHLGSLSDHGITAEKLVVLQTRIDAYTAIMQKPRAARAARKTLTSQLKAELRGANLLLREGLDRLILQCRAAAPSFVTEYQIARVIVNSAATRDFRKVPQLQALAA